MNRLSLTLIAIASLAFGIAHGSEQEQNNEPVRLPEIGRSILTHAGGAIEAEIPADWKVYEWSLGRRVHAIVIPIDANQPTEYRRDGLWLSHIALPPSRPWQPLDLDAELLRRLERLEGKPVVVERNPASTIGPWEAQSLVYALTEPDHTRSDDAPVDDILGGLMLVRTAWGLVEINAVAPRSNYEDRQHAYDQILRSLKLEAPARAIGPVAIDSTLLGSWKSEKARIRMHGTGKFEILLDSSRPMQISPLPEPSQRAVIRRLSGRFEVDDDLVKVRFDDESRSNYRWEIENGELLLTDHEGRVTQLVRIYE